MEDLTTYTDLFMEFVFSYGPKLIGAIITLVIGLWVIKTIMKGISKGFEKREMDPSLIPFLKSLIGTLLKALLVISVMSMLGIAMTSFVAILGAMGLAVGMALSGTLQNFAGGVIILILKPFKVGDFVEAQGYSGTVNSIMIFNTILKTPDNKTIIIPNGGLSTGSLINYSTESTRRVDWTVGIGYGDDIQKARQILLDILTTDSRVFKDPAPFIQVSALADSSVNLATRVWVNSSDYWAVYMETNEKIYNEFNKQGINIPFPQMDVHVHKD
ncbi:MAG: mechanosensitive ion channel family protein [Bacteroidetes bacterium]|nr:MAG: mechanosensitive ion channel family protein [Bacteroidota bacterium]MBL1143675.1 mechanosensitive ion channel family protein [Bacteroidota bacterium]MCB0801847.1 mechanosensitive ion channel [Flavobacteriales bacterium]NOG56477.1 mechanosensitive ion channel [Bacteroidota bacterium]